MKSKLLPFLLILVACVALDQWTKHVASTRLATTVGWIDQPMELTVPAQHDGATVEAFLADELTFSTMAETRELARRYAQRPDGTRLATSAKLKSGDVLVLTDRKIRLIPRYFELEYTRNPGAAFGFLAGSDSPYRIPFFLGTGVIALFVILLMLRTTPASDRLSILAFSLIAGGAIGNFIDRAAHGWVVDFIVWKATDDYRWPTFNFADVFISVGVALVLLAMGRDWRRERLELTAQEG